MTPETLTWHPAATPPDADQTVLLWVVYSDGDADWCSGWRDDGCWRDASSGGVVIGEVTHWSAPSGPVVNVRAKRGQTAQGEA